MRKVTKRNGEEVRVAVRQFKGKAYVDIRLFYADPVSGEFRHTKKGVTIPLDLWVEFVGIVDATDIKQVEPEEDIQ